MSELVHPSAFSDEVEIPSYLTSYYAPFYIHPLAIRFFEQQWLVNIILLGHYRRLREAALDALDLDCADQIVQLGCVYGDLSIQLDARKPQLCQLHIVDPIPAQIANVQRKLQRSTMVSLHVGDARTLSFRSGSVDRILAFFLLHEQPADVRDATLKEALRTLKLGGRLVIVDYDLPDQSLAGRTFLSLIATIEPFVTEFLTSRSGSRLLAGLPAVVKAFRTYCGGLYRLTIIEHDEESQTKT